MKYTKSNGSMKPDDLQRLCRVRALLTPEIHTSNDFYGHARLLKGYVGFAPYRSLKVAIEHGIFLNDYFWEADLKTECPIFLCATEAHAKEFEKRTKGCTRAVAIGPLLRYVPESSSEADRRTLLVFPAHSTHRIWTRFDNAKFISRLEQLRKEFDQVKVCIYWRDAHEGLHRVFTERDFPCVTAGHMFDPQFLVRLVQLLHTATAVMTNDIGSCILYSVLSNRPVWIERGAVEYTAESAEVLATDVPDFLEHPTVQKLLRLFSERSEEITEEQRSFIWEITGEAFVKTPEELRAILDEAEEIYRNRANLSTRVRHLLNRGKYLGGHVLHQLGFI